MRFSTFPAVMSELLRADAARPLVTFYDDATGARVELSVATYANCVNKTAGLVQDELERVRGELVLLDVPTHWLGAVWLGAAWTTGLCVTTDRSLADHADLVVCGPGGVERHAGRSDDVSVVAMSLRPLGGPFTEPLPDGMTDYGTVVPAQPDVFVPLDPPSEDDPAWRHAAETLSQGALLDAAAAHMLVERRGRLLTNVNPCSPTGRDTLLSPLLARGGVVWVANPDEATWRRRYGEERATAQLWGAVSS